MRYELMYKYKSANNADVVKRVKELDLNAAIQMCKTLETLSDDGYELISLTIEQEEAK